MAPILNVRNLQTHFFTKGGVLKAVDGVSFEIGAGEIVGLVGESGSGKSITGFSILGLVDAPGRIVGGEILFKGKDLKTLPVAEMQKMRGSSIAMIFQDPMMTLNPVLRIETQMIEAIQTHDSSVSKDEARQRSRDALGLVGISSPEERMRAYPHQFSGGDEAARVDCHCHAEPSGSDHCRRADDSSRCDDPGTGYSRDAEALQKDEDSPVMDHA